MECRQNFRVASVSPTKVWAEEKGAKIVHSTVARSTAVQVNRSPQGRSFLRLKGETRGQYGLIADAQNNFYTYQASTMFPRTRVGTRDRFSLFICPMNQAKQGIITDFRDKETKTQRGYGTCLKSHS